MMSRPLHAHADLARWILDQQIGESDRDNVAPAAQAVCAALYGRLTPLVTASGSQAFLTRSLHMAQEQFPFLAGLRGGSSPDDCLDGLGEALQDVDPEEAYEALASVIANMIELLATFIGEDLTGRILREQWPNAPLLPGRQVVEEDRA